MQAVSQSISINEAAGDRSRRLGRPPGRSRADGPRFEFALCLSARGFELVRPAKHHGLRLSQWNLLWIVVGRKCICAQNPARLAIGAGKTAASAAGPRFRIFSYGGREAQHRVRRPQRHLCQRALQARRRRLPRKPRIGLQGGLPRPVGHRDAIDRLKASYDAFPPRGSAICAPTHPPQRHPVVKGLAPAIGRAVLLVSSLRMKLPAANRSVADHSASGSALLVWKKSLPSFASWPVMSTSIRACWVSAFARLISCCETSQIALARSMSIGSSLSFSRSSVSNRWFRRSSQWFLATFKPPYPSFQSPLKMDHLLKLRRQAVD